jgi:hypothetical protein
MPTGLRSATGWDPDTFAKTVVQRDRAATAGERAAAQTAMAALARRAGITVEEALARTGPKPPPRNPFEEIFNSPAFQAESRAREAKRATRRAAVEAAGGNAQSVFDETDLEARLRTACAPLIVQVPIIGGLMDTLQGWHSESFARMPEAVARAVEAAAPTDGLKEVWSAYQSLERLADDRQAFFRDYEHGVCLRAYLTVIEHRLDTLPALTMNDLRARMAWLDHIIARDWHRGPPEDTVLIRQLKADVERLWTSVRTSKTVPDSETGSP